jgi:hypothetical protein
MLNAARLSANSFRSPFARLHSSIRIVRRETRADRREGALICHDHWDPICCKGRRFTAGHREAEIA